MPSRKHIAGLLGLSPKRQSPQWQSHKRQSKWPGPVQAVLRLPCLMAGIMAGMMAMPLTAWADDTVPQTDASAAPHMEAAAVPAAPGADAGEPGSAQDKAQEQAQDKVPAADAMHFPAITDFAPGTVYSGTLGELTRLQAGQEMARAALSLKEIQARILETENNMARARREMEAIRNGEEDGEGNEQDAGMADPSAQNSSGQHPSPKQSLKQSVDELRAGLDALAGDVAALRQDKEKAQSCLVIAVRSQGAGLVAEIATREGRYLVRSGDHVPGVGRIESVSRTRVMAGGKSLPWK
ncbi:MAG: hypothetical protein Q3990_06170 [Desulfovibrionaceae bacterium]|nr:hypothetical protein [Desulfovibrionaceae bacterium]